MGDGVALQGHGDAVDVVPDQLRRVDAELRGEDPVKGAGGAAALNVPGHHVAGLDAHHLLQLLGYIGGGGEMLRGALGLPLLLLHLGLLQLHGALRHGDDGEALVVLCPALHDLRHLVDGIGDLGNQNDVGAAGDAGIQGQPAGLVPHDLHAHDAAVTGGGGVDAVDGLGGDVVGGMEAEGEIRSVDIVIDGLRKADDVQPLLAQQIRGFVGAVAAQGDQAVQLQILVGFLHRGDLVHVVALDFLHVAVGGAAGSENGPAQGQDAGELAAAHQGEIPLDQAAVTVMNSDDLRIEHLIGGADGSADGRVQAGAVAAAGQDADSFLCFDHVRRSSFLYVSFRMGQPFTWIISWEGRARQSLFRRLPCTGTRDLRRRTGGASREVTPPKNVKKGPFCYPMLTKNWLQTC